MYSYKAMKDGTLSNPYRHVKAGDIVNSTVPIKASWLSSPDTPEPAPLPLMPILQPAGSAVEKILVPPVGQSDGYQENMKTLIAKENAADGITPVVTDNNGDSGAGTGSTEVL